MSINDKITQYIKDNRELCRALQVHAERLLSQHRRSEYAIPLEVFGCPVRVGKVNQDNQIEHVWRDELVLELENGYLIRVRSSTSENRTLEIGRDTEVLFQICHTITWEGNPYVASLFYQNTLVSPVDAFPWEDGSRMVWQREYQPYMTAPRGNANAIWTVEDALKQGGPFQKAWEVALRFKETHPVGKSRMTPHILGLAYTTSE